MPRPPSHERLDEVEPDAATIKTVLKRSQPAARAEILAWLCLYYNDEGQRFGTLKHRRIAIDGKELWLVGIPKRKPKG